MATTIGTAYINIAPNMSGIQGKITGGLKGSGSQFADQFGGEISSKSAVIIGAIAGIAQSAVTKAMSLVTNTIGTAINRVDTLSAAQRTFQYMGFAANDSAAAVKAVTASIQGLPTPLDGAIRGMTALAATYGDVGLGQKMFTSLNDAVLGFGGTAAMVDSAVQQISQLPMDGPLDAQTWNSLRNSGLTPVLVAMGKDMGKSVNQLKDDFGSGKLKVQDFVNELIKMDQQGGGGLTNLHNIAMNATSGISTGFANMQTAISRGLANIIQAVGQKNISDAIATIGKAFEKVLDIIAKDVPIIVADIKGFFDYVVRNKDVFGPIAVAIGAVVGAIVAWKTALFAWSEITKVATGIQIAFNLVMDANPIMLIALAIIGLVSGLIYFFTQTQIGKQIWQDFTTFLSGIWDGLVTGFRAVGGFFTGIWDAISGAVSGFINWFGEHWRLIIAIVLGPLGLLIDFVTAYWSQISGAISAAISFIWGIITGVFNAVAGFMGAVFGPPISAIVGAFSWLGGVIGNIVGGVWSAISSAFGAVTGFLGSVGGTIVGMFANAGSWLWNAGVNIIQGLISGAGSLLSKVGDMFLNLVPGWIKEPFKKALGIHSPSTVFAGYADNTIEGYTNTIAGRQGDVTDAINDMANAAIDGMTNNPLTAQFNTQANTPSPVANSQVANQGNAQQPSNGPAIVQNNSIYSQVDLNSVTRELAWQIGR